MAGDGNRSQSLKEALFESLSAILSPVHEVRAAGEEQVKALEVTEEFGVHLAEFTVDAHGVLAIRQLSSVLLKQYVEAHWSQHSEKFRPPETSELAKASIRQILPLGLKEAISKVRSSVAYAVSAIAHWDWPEAWPELFDILMAALTSGHSDAVHGAMRVLTEFCREVTDQQMPRVAPVILPEMYKIFTQSEVYGIRTRGRAVDIFNTCSNMILAMNDLHKGVAKDLLYPILSQFTEAFVQSLQVQDGPVSDSGLKMEILRALTTLVKNYPQQMHQLLVLILPPVWTTLTQSADTYIRTVVNDTEEADDPVDSDAGLELMQSKKETDVVNTDDGSGEPVKSVFEWEYQEDIGEVLGFESLVFSVFDFINGMIETNKFRSTIKKSMDHLLYYIVLYMQITEEQVKMWTVSPDKFVEDEDDDTFSYSVRISAQDLLMCIASEFPKEASMAIGPTILRHIQEAETAKAAGNPNWWKLHEGAMLALGSIRNLIIESVKKEKIQFDLQGILQTVVLADLNQNVSPFLLGRCLWLASRCTDTMSPELLQKFLQATVSGLQNTQPPSVRISAVRAVFGFSEHLKSTGNPQLLQPYISDMIEGLLVIATQFSSEVLALVLETMCIVISLDQQFTASIESKITPLAIAVFLKYSGDPLIVSLAQDLFKVLSENPSCIQLVQQRLVPTLVSILHAPVEKIPIGMQSVALDILQTLVRSSSVPLSDPLMNQAFPAAVQCTVKTDDNATMQSGGECLRAYVSTSLTQVSEWHDGQGQNGIYYIVQIVSRLLDPKTSEFTATFVGRLVSILISKLGQNLGENLDLMLRAVLSKMQQAETLSVLQSLVLVFAQLMNTQMSAVLDFLTNVPGPTGKPALEFVLTEWCSKQHLFYGAYEGKVSSVALCKLLQHAIETGDDRLQSIQVKGDQIFNHSAGIRTRSKTAQSPEQWTMVPVMVKIYKLLINELSNQIESSMSTKAALGDDEDEEEDGAWDETEENGDTMDDDLGCLLGTGDFTGYDFVDDGDEEEDPDALTDPVFQIELQTYLTDFIRSLSQQSFYSTLSQHHSDQEKQVLRTIGIQL